VLTGCRTRPRPSIDHPNMCFSRSLRSSSSLLSETQACCLAKSWTSLKYRNERRNASTIAVNIGVGEATAHKATQHWLLNGFVNVVIFCIRC